MRKYLLLIMFLFSSGVFAESFVEYVDPFIATAGDHGQLDPSANVPFGYVKLGPDTDPINHSGYDYNAKKIWGFSINRTIGTGCAGAGGNIRLKPFVGSPSIKSEGFIKNSEKAAPGYYRVTMDSQIDVELTTTNQVGWHRYTYPVKTDAGVLIDLTASFEELLSYEYHIVNANEINGKIQAENVCSKGIYTIYFNIYCDHEFNNLKNKDGKLISFFQMDDNPVVNIQVTVSSISPEQAAKDRNREIAAKTFKQVKTDAEKAWDKILGRVKVFGNKEYKKLFYTCLFRIYQTPVNTTSPFGKYRGTDGEIYDAEGYVHYDSWSIWDTFRTKFPLISLLEPEYMRDFCLSLLDLYRTGKYAWAGPFETAPTVRTEHAEIVLLDAYQKGIPFDLDKVYDYAVLESDNLPWVSPDNKLESAYDYWALSQMAEILGRKDDADYYTSRAQEYRKIWNEKFKTMGEKSDIMHGDGLYEGTLWQYRWFVPYDVPGIISLVGGKQQFLTELEYFFDNHLYNHGNQPDIQAPYMFNAAGAPWLTQKWVNAILTKEIPNYYGTHEKWEKPYVNRIYKAEPAGFIPEMDDDDGTMSAWYVCSAMGLYPLCVGKPEYQISTPIFEKIEINLANGNTFVIENKNFSDKNIYIQKALLNDKEYNNSALLHKDILKGGKLLLECSETPNKAWGTGK